jgi:PAS domain S-box-containing protein
MLGECMLSQETIYMTDVPKNYIHITSGLGQAIPTNIIIVPLLFNGNFYGAFEIASFHKLERYQIEFLERVSEHIAAEISTRSSVTNTEKLLSDSQELTQQLRSKEEEMRQHMEELTATQEEMNRKQSELSSVFAAINNTVASVEFDLRGNILSSNSIFSGIAGYANDVLRKMSYKSLLSEAEREKQQHEIMWQNLIDGKFFSGEFKMQNKLGEDMWLSGTFNPILDSSNAPYKIIMIAQFISQEKARQLELSSVLSATKNSVPYLEVGPNFELKSANDRFLKLFNVKRMELRDKEFSCFLAKNVNRSKLVEIVNQPYYEDYIDFAIGKEVVAYRTSFTPVRDHHNKVTKILIILSDRTQKNIEIAAVA